MTATTLEDMTRVSLQAAVEVPPRMLTCTVCSKDIGLVPREVHEEKANTVRCANCQLDGRAEPRWMNEEGEEEDVEDYRPRCYGCGHSSFMLRRVQTMTTDTSDYDPEDSTIYFSDYGDTEDMVQCANCGRNAERDHGYEVE